MQFTFSEARMSERPYKCSHCFKLFASKFSMDRHVRGEICKSKPSTGSSVACTHCAKTFASNASKCRHLTNNVCGWKPTEGKSNKSLECPRCQKTFSSNNTKCRHVRSNICVEKTPLSSASLSSASPPPPPPPPSSPPSEASSKSGHDCVTCGSNFGQIRYLVRHRYRCKGAPPLACTRCHRVFKTRQSKSNHMRRFVCGGQSTVNNFGEEDFSYITNAPDYFEKIKMLMTLGKYAVPELLTWMFLNDDHLENITIRKNRRNDKYVEIRVKGVWTQRLMMDVLGLILKRMETIHHAYFSHMRNTLIDNKPDANYRRLVYPMRVYAHVMLWYGWRCEEISQLTLLNYPEDDNEQRRRWNDMSSICMEKIYERTKQLRAKVG